MSDQFKHKGITDPDFEASFRRQEGEEDEDIDEVTELFEDLTGMEFERPDLRKVKSTIGRDPELFDMLTKLSERKK